MFNLSKIFSFGLFVFLTIAGFAQVDTISIQRHSLNTAYLKEGNNQYVCYNKDSAGKLSYLIVWERKVSFEKWKGRDAIVVSQRGLFEDSNRNTTEYTVSDRHTFQTIYHRRVRKTGVEAFNYDENHVEGADTVPQNTKKGFNLQFTNTPYNWELDLETLSMLPIKKIGEKMAICFYLPGKATLPRYYLIEVVRDEILPAVNGMNIDCRVIKLTFDKDNYDLLWYSKGGHEFLKMESWSPEGVFNKVKLFSSLQQL
jgi:hypothetical protein